MILVDEVVANMTLGFLNPILNSLMKKNNQSAILQICADESTSSLFYY